MNSGRKERVFARAKNPPQTAEKKNLRKPPSAFRRHKTYRPLKSNEFVSTGKAKTKKGKTFQGNNARPDNFPANPALRKHKYLRQKQFNL
ncbi:MAG TPA: hypothetical protein PKY59_15315 [Pyrinomonadaceae bacterium]|nr:hypothetical protein [Pyrinomonadaceae bacterium]